MTAQMNSTSAYLDFFDIAVEAYESKKTDIYRRIMTTLISSYRSLLQEIEIKNSDLVENETLSIAEEELDLFYDTMYDTVDLVKLLKKHLSPLQTNDGLFADLYHTVEKLHEALLHHIDIISTQEVNELQNRYKKAS